MLDLFRLALSVKYPTSLKDRVRWFARNARYGSLFPLRNFEEIGRDIGKTTWSDIDRHFEYVTRYYRAKDVLKAPVVNATMYRRELPLHHVADQKICDVIEAISFEWSAILGERKQDISNWLSLFGAIISKAEELHPGLSNKISGKRFVEFGPGLGLVGQLYSKHFQTEGLFYDLQSLINLRSILFEAAKKAECSYFVEPQELSDFTQLSRSLGDKEDFTFISSWALTETNQAVRDEFFPIIQNSFVALIVSNPEFDSIDNFDYLNGLAGRLPTHEHYYSALSFLNNIPNWQKGHQLHLFVRKTQAFRAS